MSAVKMCLECCSRRRVVEVDVKEELLIRVWEVVSKLTLDRAVARTDVILQNVATYFADIFDLGELGGGPVVQEFSTLKDILPVHTRGTGVAGIVEGSRVEPKSVDGTAEAIPFGGCEEATVFEVVFPFLGRINFFPLVRCPANFDDLFQESEGERSLSNNMCRLT